MEERMMKYGVCGLCRFRDNLGYWLRIHSSWDGRSKFVSVCLPSERTNAGIMNLYCLAKSRIIRL